MKTVVILIALLGVIGWSVSAQACRVPPPIRWEGDPDELQAKRILDVGGQRLGSIASRPRTDFKAGDSVCPVAAATGPEAGKRRAVILAGFGGRTFLWEK